jgi:hypothetical protein
MKLILASSLLIIAAAALALSQSSGTNKTRFVNPAFLQKSDNYNYGVQSPMGVVTKSEVAESAGLPKDDGHALILMEQQWNEALKAHDPAWFEKNLADDFTDI